MSGPWAAETKRGRYRRGFRAQDDLHKRNAKALYATFRWITEDIVIDHSISPASNV